MDTPGPGMYLALLLLLAFSAFFSASETALSSVNRIRMKNKADDGDKKAQRVLGLSDDYDRTLSAILIGNNVVNLTASSISTVIATSLLGQQGAAVATAVITVLVLVFGEILPKSFAKDHAERVSMSMGGPLYIVKTLLAPLVWVFVQIKRLFTGRRSSELNVQPSVTEEELKTIIDTVGEEGVLDRQETDIIQSAIEFDNTTVQDILVPRVDMAAAALDAPPEEIIRLCVEGGYSRIPVYEGTIDNVVGVLYAKDLLARLAAGKPIEPAALKRDVLFVYRSKRISELLAEFRRAKQHMAVVTDEHGGTLGLVTMEDILEELVGEIWDETDKDETPIRQLSENSWQVEGDVNVEDFFDAIGFVDKTFDCDYNSVGGWALAELEHIPSAGESFGYKQLHVTIRAVKDQRIESLLVTRGEHGGGDAPPE